MLLYGYTDKTTYILLDKPWKKYFVSIAEYKQGDRKFMGKPKIRDINSRAGTVLSFPHIKPHQKKSCTSLGKLNWL